MVNIYQPNFDEPRSRDGFVCRRARLGRQAGSRDLGASLWELPPGQAAYPYHFHVAEEEMIVVLAGRPRLREPGGWRRLEAGEVVSFLVGESGGHQIHNDGDGVVRFLAFSSQRPDIVVYPDSGKLGAFERKPEGGGVYECFQLEDSVDYWEGERPPPTDEKD
jgi:uncharacterized cupin superfamily protein